jgi:hypothetical protein
MFGNIALQWSEFQERYYQEMVYQNSSMHRAPILINKWLAVGTPHSGASSSRDWVCTGGSSSRNA